MSSTLVRNRMTGPYAWCYWTMIACNVLIPQLFWFRWFRTTPWAMFVDRDLVNVGMWFERFVIVVTSLHRDYLPSSWRMFYPTWVDLCNCSGGFGLFATPFLLFIRFVPMVALSEVKACLPRGRPAPPPQHGEETGRPTATGGARRRSRATAAAASTGSWRGSSGPAELLAAAGRLRAAGYRRFDTYLAVPDPWHGRGDGAAPLEGPVVHAGRRAVRAGVRPVAPVVPERGGLPADHRRQAAEQHRGVRADHLRDDDPVRGFRGGRRDAAARTACPGCTTRCSAAGRSPGRPTTASSWRSRPATRSSIRDETSALLAGGGTEVELLEV